MFHGPTTTGTYIRKQFLTFVVFGKFDTSNAKLVLKNESRNGLHSRKAEHEVEGCWLRCLLVADVNCNVE